jgi:hypothetical protein
VLTADLHRSTREAHGLTLQIFDFRDPALTLQEAARHRTDGDPNRTGAQAKHRIRPGPLIGSDPPADSLNDRNDADTFTFRSAGGVLGCLSSTAEHDATWRFSKPVIPTKSRGNRSEPLLKPIATNRPDCPARAQYGG